ncbi:DUF1490 family protein [Saccharopolyspora erythraea]|uniref:DUF1490 family protein n=1 Tax=Saccharopolyspora erythraea TaxID=1836 RepID=UPI001BA8BB66|nr:DUF1490 family protein [Saccharopolyspora erythraea]QUH03988.1 DUF1490 family protein [Saccharopolyspora erythraea]
MHFLLGSFAAKLVHYTVSGTVGVAVVRAAEHAAPQLKPKARELAVNTMARGIVVGRTLSGFAEEARLKAGDLVAEAHESLGQEAPAPTSVQAKDEHGH